MDRRLASFDRDRGQRTNRDRGACDLFKTPVDHSTSGEGTLRCAVVRGGLFRDAAIEVRFATPGQVHEVLGTRPFVRIAPRATIVAGDRHVGTDRDRAPRASIGLGRGMSARGPGPDPRSGVAFRDRPSGAWTDGELGRAAFDDASGGCALSPRRRDEGRGCASPAGIDAEGRIGSHAAVGRTVRPPGVGRPAVSRRDRRLPRGRRARRPRGRPRRPHGRGSVRSSRHSRSSGDRGSPACRHAPRGVAVCRARSRGGRRSPA